VVHGPEVPLRKSAVEMLALAIHELATNAVKYGALASAVGRLSVTWRNEVLPKRQLVLEWVEHGVARPSDVSAQRRGYGRALIEEALPYSLGAETRFELADDTLRCRISLPLTINGEIEVAA
jgi:two-component sensor histidine kinase